MAGGPLGVERDAVVRETARLRNTWLSPQRVPAADAAQSSGEGTLPHVRERPIQWRAVDVVRTTTSRGSVSENVKKPSR